LFQFSFEASKKQKANFLIELRILECLRYENDSCWRNLSVSRLSFLLRHCRREECLRTEYFSFFKRIIID